MRGGAEPARLAASRTARATAAPHKPDCPCGRCVHRRRLAGLPDPESRGNDPANDVLARRVLALQRAVYRAQRAVDRAHKLLAQVMPAQRRPGASGDPMQAISEWVAAGQPDWNFPDEEASGRADRKRKS